jgi:hypothetical protein
MIAYRWICSLLLLCICLSANAQTPTPTPLPLLVGIQNGTDYRGNGFILYASTILIGIDTGGIMLIPMTGCKNPTEGSWNFMTAWPFFTAHKIDQVSMTLFGDFVYQLEGGYTFGIDPTDENKANLIAADKKITDGINLLIKKTMSQWEQDMFGNAVPIGTPDNFSSFYTNITAQVYAEEYESLYSRDWSKAFLTMVQALVWCDNQLTNPTYAQTCANVLSAVTPNLLQLKSNEYNTDKQCAIFGCPGKNPLPYPTAWLGGSYICSASAPTDPMIKFPMSFGFGRFFGQQ